MFFKSKIALATITGCALFSTPAAAEVEQIGSYGPFLVLADDETATCGLGINGPNGDTFTIAYHYPTNMTALQYSNPQYDDLTGQQYSINVHVDGTKYTWLGTGDGQGVMLTSTDPNVPSVLIDATVFGMSYGNQAMFSINSDENFDAAMTDVVMCSVILSQ